MKFNVDEKLFNLEQVNPIEGWSYGNYEYALQVIDAANEVIDSIDREELAKFLALKHDQEDEEAQVLILVPSTFSYPIIHF